MTDELLTLRGQNATLRAAIDKVVAAAGPLALALAYSIAIKQDGPVDDHPAHSPERVRQNAITSLERIQANLRERALALIEKGFANESDFRGRALTAGATRAFST